MTKTKEALKEAFKACPTIGIRRYWVVSQILPYIHQHFDPFTVGSLCREFGISLDRYMFFRWHMLCGMNRGEALRYKKAL